MSRAVEAAPDTESLVRALVAGVTGRPVRAVARMAYGHGSVTYRVDTDGGPAVIVRTNTDPDVYAGTLGNLDTLRGLGFPVPSVLEADVTGSRFPFAYVITDTFPGRDLGFELAGMTEAQMTRLAEQIVGFEQRVSQLPKGCGHGFMPIGAAGGHGRWVDAVRADRRSLGAAVDAAADPGREPGLANLFSDVWSALDRSSARLDAIEPICFLDYLTTNNVIVHDGALRGVVDFDVVCYGDPMYWLALTQVAILSDVGAEGQFYVDELIRLWEPSGFEHANLALYSALPKPDLAAFSIPATWIAGVTIAIVASIETLLSLQAVDRLDPLKRHSPPDRELLAQGLANSISGALGGLPLTAVIVRSSANVAAGAKERFAALVHGALLLVAVVLAGPLINRIPLACLAAVLIQVGLNLCKPAMFRMQVKLGLTQLLPFAVTIAAVLALDLLKGVIVGIVVGILFVLYENSQRAVVTE